MRLTCPILAFLVLVAFSACASPAVPDVTPSPVTIPDGGSILKNLPPSDAPTVESPTLHLVITVADESTRQPVTANVRVDNVTAEDVTVAELYVPANKPHDITVTAPGYLVWSVRLETNLYHNKRMEIPVLLRPAPQDTTS